MLQNPSFSVLVAVVVRRPFRQAQGPELVEGLASVFFDRLKASGVTTAATAKPKSFDFAHDRPFGLAHGHRQASEYQTHGE
jgi:hypothetical protein